MYIIYLRIVGYVATIALHVGNALWMITSFRGDVMKNREVKHFSEMQIYFFTCWTFTFQVIYAAISLYCEVSSLKNSKKPGQQLVKWLNVCRDTFFFTIVWPSSMLVFIVFWSFFYYDRALLYPKSIDLAISSTSNHIMHTHILFIMLWELIVKPRTNPRNHKWYLLVMIGMDVIYFATVIGVYWFKGLWVYPIFGLLIGTVYYYLFFAATVLLLVCIYYMHWVLNDFIWCSREEVELRSPWKTKKKIITNISKAENSAKKNA